MPLAVIVIGIISLSVCILVIPANRILTKLGLPRWYLVVLFMPVIGVAVFLYLVGFSKPMMAYCSTCAP
jgi:hypothetical protein